MRVSVTPAQRGAQPVDRALGGTPARVCQAATADRLCVLAYHGIDDPVAFAAQLDWLCEHRTIVEPDQVAAAVAGRVRLPRRATLLTFDDGARSVLDHGLPAVHARGLRGVVFVVPGVIETDQPFWWEEVTDLLSYGGRSPRLTGCETSDALRMLKSVHDRLRREIISDLRTTAHRPARRVRQLSVGDLDVLARGGLAVANHTLTHPCLDRCPDDVLAAEIIDGHDRLTAWFGRAPTAFAYPNGNWDARAHRMLDRLGYRTAFLFDHRLARVPSQRPLMISRVRVSSTTSLPRFRMIVSGLHPQLHRLRGRR